MTYTSRLTLICKFIEIKIEIVYTFVINTININKFYCTSKDSLVFQIVLCVANSFCMQNIDACKYVRLTKYYRMSGMYGCQVCSFLRIQQHP